MQRELTALISLHLFDFPQIALEHLEAVQMLLFVVVLDIVILAPQLKCAEFASVLPSNCVVERVRAKKQFFSVSKTHFSPQNASNKGENEQQTHCIYEFPFLCAFYVKSAYLLCVQALVFPCC